MYQRLLLPASLPLQTTVLGVGGSADGAPALDLEVPVGGSTVLQNSGGCSQGLFFIRSKHSSQRVLVPNCSI